ncbi:MAG: TolC family protein [Zoogloeaceae bacterium]|jgi:outer membrane protein TolC|nr:TolC family protein [Zoogloeaceae bacterium]
MRIRFFRLFLPLVALGMAGVIRGETQTADAWNWDDLRAWVQQGPGVRLAQFQERIAQSQEQEAEADSALRILVGASFSRVREPITEEQDRAYERAQAHTSVLWEFLGARETRESRRLDAHANLALRQSENEMASIQAQEELARVYNAYVRGQQREQLILIFLEGRKIAGTRLKQRTQSKVMLEAERLALMHFYDEADSALARERLIQNTALRQMRFLTGQNIPPRHAPSPAGVPACQTRESLAQNRASHPLLAKARQNMDWAEARLHQPRYGGVEAGLRLGHAQTHDLGGSNGHDTMIGLEVSIPWEWKTRRNAQESQDRGRRDAAAEEYAQIVARFELEFQNAWEQWQLETQYVQERTRHFVAAQEALRVARLRLPSEEGWTRLIAAQHALYTAAMEIVNALRQQDMAATDLWRYAPDCPLQEITDDPARAILAQTQDALSKNTRKTP